MNLEGTIVYFIVKFEIIKGKKATLISKTFFDKYLDLSSTT